jgi:hypothetical protein
MYWLNNNTSSVLESVDVTDNFRFFLSQDTTVPVLLYMGPTALYSNELVNTVMQETQLIDYVCFLVRLHPGVLMDQGGLFIEMPFVKQRDGNIVPYSNYWTLCDQALLESRIGSLDKSVVEQLQLNNPAEQAYPTLTPNIWRIS